MGNKQTVKEVEEKFYGQLEKLKNKIAKELTDETIKNQLVKDDSYGELGESIWTVQYNIFFYREIKRKGLIGAIKNFLGGDFNESLLIIYVDEGVYKNWDFHITKISFKYKKDEINEELKTYILSTLKNFKEFNKTKEDIEIEVNEL